MVITFRNLRIYQWWMWIWIVFGTRMFSISAGYVVLNSYIETARGAVAGRLAVAQSVAGSGFNSQPHVLL